MQPIGPDNAARGAEGVSASGFRVGAAGGEREIRREALASASGSQGADVEGAGEKTILGLRPHPVTILLRSLAAIVLTLVYVLWLKAVVTRVSGAVIAERVLWAAVVITAVRVAFESARWWGRRYVLTDRRVWAWDGVLRRWRVEVALDRVQNIVLHRTLVERVLGLGTIGVSSAAGGAGLEVLWISVAGPVEALGAVSRARDAAMGGKVSNDGGMSPADRSSRVSSQSPTDAPGAGGGARPSAALEGVTGSRRRPLVIGLVGGIGSGKSAVAEALSGLGAVVSDSDAQARSMLDRPDVRATLAGWWGEKVLRDDGIVDRRAVASIVFADVAERRRLEGLIHPLLREGREALKRQAAETGAPMVVIDAPLLFEAGVDVECDEVWFVESSRQQRLARVSASRGWDEGELDRRESAQLPLEEKRRRATRVIVNDGDLAALREKVGAMARGALGASVPA